MGNKLPKVIMSSEIDLGGFIMHVHNLDNGQRVIDAEDMERFFSDATLALTQEQAIKLVQALKSQPPTPIKQPPTKEATK